MPPFKIDRAKLEELLKKRFFFAPSFSIYGGVAGLYDYGPPGCALQANIVNLWRSFFILEEQMLEIDAAMMTPYDVLKTSGHVDRFTDYMVKDVKTGEFFRADHLLEANLEKFIADKKVKADDKVEYEGILAKMDGYSMEELQGLFDRFKLKSDAGNELTPAIKFNLMFGTDIGPTGYLKGFLRPETAQGMFVNFKRLLEYNNGAMPFAAAQIGKSFRNEISPRAGLLRVREFLMAEIEHFVHPTKKEHPKFDSVKDYVLELLPSSVQESGRNELIRMSVGQAVSEKIINNQTLGYFLVRVSMFLKTIGIKEEHLRFRQHMKNEMAHYATDCWDAEIQSSYGWIECVGNADRACYDLSVHSAKTKEDLVATERLPAPIQVNVSKVIVNKKEIGVTFKKDAKILTDYLESLDTTAVIALEEQLKTNDTIKINDQEFKIMPSMLSIIHEVETRHVEQFVPSVIEPSFGIGRIIYSLLEHSFWTREGDENRAVLSFPASVAPVKCVVLPISHDDQFNPAISKLSASLRTLNLSFQVDDSGASLGKRYARNDEIGIPFSITVDFQTLSDSSVTIRERDSTKQIRLPVPDVGMLISDLCSAKMDWNACLAKYPIFTQQQTAQE